MCPPAHYQSLKSAYVTPRRPDPLARTRHWVRIAVNPGLRRGTSGSALVNQDGRVRRSGPPTWCAGRCGRPAARHAAWVRARSISAIARSTPPPTRPRHRPRAGRGIWLQSAARSVSARVPMDGHHVEPGSVPVLPWRSRLASARAVCSRCSWDDSASYASCHFHHTYGGVCG